MLHGWGVRPSDYQTTVTVQQQILPRVSADFSFTHRTFHGFLVTNDLARNVNSAYETYTLTAPDDPRLPSSVAGQPITFYSVTSAANVAAQRFLTWETTYGPERDSHWDGFDITLNARTRQGVTAAGRNDDRPCGRRPVPDDDAVQQHRTARRRRGIAGPARLPQRRSVADHRARPGELHDPEGGRPRQRRHSVAAAAGDYGDVAGAELGDRHGARPSAGGRNGNRHDQPPVAA